MERGRGWLWAGLAVLGMVGQANAGAGQVVPARQTAGQWLTEYLVASPWAPSPNTGWQATPELACSMMPALLNRQGLNEGRQCGSRLVTPTCCGVMVFGDTQGACATGYMCDRSGGFDVHRQTRWVPPGSTCPANAFLVDASRCQCQPGFQAVDGQCVEVPTPPLGCATGDGGFVACPGHAPWVPAVRPAPGTPQDGGPNPNAGEPGEDAASDPTQADASLGPGSGTCRAVEAVGNPIFAGSGNKHQREVDYAGAGGLALVRHYNSSLPGWVHNFGVRILADRQEAVAIRPDGRGLRFVGAGPGVWTPPVGTADRLELLPDAAPGQAQWKYSVAATDATEWYDAQGRLLRIARRNGQAFVAEQADGLLVAISDPWGRRLQFTYDAQRRLTAVLTPEGRAIRYAYDTAGRLVQALYADGTSRQYLYEDARWPLALTGVVDERGIRQVTWAYDAAGRAVESVLAGGVGRHQLSFAEGTVRVLDAHGFQRTQAYGRAGERWLFAGQDAACPGCIGNAASRLVDPTSGLPLRTSDFLGRVDAFTWYADRRLLRSETQAVGLPEQRGREFEWHPSFALPVRVTEDGRATESTYDSAGNLLAQSITDAATGQSRRWSRRYNALGQVTRFTDPAGAAWQSDYDSLGNLQSVRDPLGQVHQFTHDVNGWLVEHIDPLGTTTTLARDARGRVIARTFAGETTRITYNPDGRLAAVTRPNGHETRHAYDAAGRLVAVSDNRGMRLVYELDAAGNRIRETVLDAGGQVVRTVARAFSATGVLGSQHNAAGAGPRFEHDANGRLVGETDALSNSTRRMLDSLGRTVAVTFADNQSARQSWNVRDDLTQVTDPRNVATRYEVNAFGEVTAETSPDIGVRRYGRDARGAVVQVEDAKGQVTRIARNALGLPVNVTEADGRQATLGYTATGLLADYTDSSGRTQLSRDGLGRVTIKRQQVSDNPRTPTEQVMRYTWRDGDLESIDYPSGLTVRYQREAGRIVGISAQRPWGEVFEPVFQGKALASPAVSLVKNLTHTDLGQPRAWDWFNGDTARRTFDDGQLVSTEFAQYTHDATGRITGVRQQLMTRGVAGVARLPVQWQVGYDNRDRITQFAGAGGDTRYTYDANSNRLSAVEAAPASAPSGAGVTLPRDRPIDVTTLAFDSNGALTGDGLHLFDYDAAGRLSAVRTPQAPAEMTVPYLHNALGQRVFKGVPQATGVEPARLQPVPQPDPLPAGTSDPSFIHQWLQRMLAWMHSVMDALRQKTMLGSIYVHGDGPLPEWTLLGEYDNGTATGQTYTEYIWLPTEDGGAIPIAFYRSGRFYAIHTDHLGTPRQVTDDANQPVWQWPYSAFGDNRPIGVVDASTLQPTTPAVVLNLGMPGQYWDEESGMYYNYHRTYCAHCGRYLQPDPIGLEGGMNRFAYVNQNSLDTIDPLGLDSTNWSNTTGGRSRLNFPTNGNWGGKCWSGGQYSCGGNPIGMAPPTDSADACYQRHDYCYDSCGSKKNCIKACDRALVGELDSLPDDPRRWPSPPRIGTEEDSRTYRDAARRLFR